MQCLVIGYGSIGSRHARVLSNLGCDVSLVTSQQVKGYPCYTSVEKAIKKTTPHYVIVSNSTHLHYLTLVKLLASGFSKTILVEKPLFSKIETLENHDTKGVLVAYNLRFHELLLKAKELLKNEELIAFSAFVGQYLPTWRKKRDYKNCYFSKKEQGGGVLRDLSHELDYALWFCGQCIEVTASGGHHSELEISSDDIYSILMSCEYCPVVTLQLNCLNRTPKREIIIQTKRHTLCIDLIFGTFTLDGKLIHQTEDAINRTYIKQHEAALQGNHENFCSYTQGLNLIKLISAIEKANLNKRWITT